MKKFISITTVIVLFVSLCISFTACGSGPSEEKVNKVQGDYAELINETNEVTQLYENAIANGVPLDQSAIDTYNKGVDYVNELGEIELGKATDADLDDYIKGIGDIRNSLKSLKSTLESKIEAYEQQAGQEDNE